MKKWYIITILLFCVFLNFYSVRAAEINMRTGITYNTYQLNQLNEFAQERGGSPVNSGKGINFGVETEIYRNVYAGVTTEYMSVYYNDLETNEDIKASNLGLMLNGAYSLNDYLRFNAAVVQYIVNVNYFDNDDTAYSPGAKLGLEGNMDINNRIDIGLGSSYRFAEVGDYDFSGMEINLLVNIKF